MTQFPVQINLELPDLKSSPEQIAVAMDDELNRFQAFFTAKGNQPLMMIERSILKTYLAWKLLYEAGCPASQG
jgi:hypothetical protein